jgi:hypothetical protein
MIEGVTTAIVGFIFVCIAFPKLVKERRTFYMAVWGVLAMILLKALGSFFSPTSSFQLFVNGFLGLLQVFTLFAMLLATGGFSVGKLAGDLIEVMRRGEEEKEYIVPLRSREKAEAEQSAFRPPEVPPAPPRKSDPGSIPME